MMLRTFTVSVDLFSLSREQLKKKKSKLNHFTPLPKIFEYLLKVFKVQILLRTSFSVPASSGPLLTSPDLLQGTLLEPLVTVV